MIKILITSIILLTVSFAGTQTLELNDSKCYIVSYNDGGLIMLQEETKIKKLLEKKIKKLSLQLTYHASMNDSLINEIRSIQRH